jgi:5-methylcytosine-specific restriction endonuclease McrA
LYYKKFYVENRDEQLARSSRYKRENPLVGERHEQHKKKSREKWRANKEENSKKRKAAYERDDGLRQRNIDRAKAWYYENKDRQLDAAKTYYKENSDAIKQRVRRYELSNPDKTKQLGRIKANRRRARLFSSSGQYKPADVENLFLLQRGRCANCGCQLSSGYHIDHRVPVAKGGDNSKHNIELLCPSCNMRKAAKLPHEFAQENGRLL